MRATLRTDSADPSSTEPISDMQFARRAQENTDKEDPPRRKDRIAIDDPI